MSISSIRPGDAWAEHEIRAAVSSYLRMLAMELSGQPFSKTAFRNELLAHLPARSKGSVEFKHQNISAVLSLIGAPHIAGYKPAANFQSSLVDEVIRQLGSCALPSGERSAAVLPVMSSGASLPRLRIEAAPPPMKAAEPQRQMIDHARSRVYRNVDWAARDAANRSLGAFGEELVLDHEIYRLRSAGQSRLAARVVHASKQEGDGLGYDIRSFEADGSPRLIEVKTTAGGPFTPFAVTDNELEVSRVRAADYTLSRVYSASSSPTAFELKGSIADTCKLRPTQYRASVG